MTDDTGLQHFLNDTANHRLLTAQEERELARRFAAGDDRARQELILCNIRLVVSIARGFRNRGLPYGDIIQEGVLGLDRAARKFDPDRGYRFSTYATLWIKQAIQRGLSGAGTTIRLPPLVADRRLKARTLLANNPELGLDDIAEMLEVTAQHVSGALVAAEVVASLDQYQWDGDDYTLLDVLEDEDSPDPSELFPVNHAALTEAMLCLNDEQRAVVTARFGLDGPIPREEMEKGEAKEDVRTFKQVAIQLGMDAGRVKKVLEESLRILQDVLE